MITCNISIIFDSLCTNKVLKFMLRKLSDQEIAVRGKSVMKRDWCSIVWKTTLQFEEHDTTKFSPQLNCLYPDIITYYKLRSNQTELKCLGRDNSWCHYRLPHYQTFNMWISYQKCYIYNLCIWWCIQPANWEISCLEFWEWCKFTVTVKASKC